MVDGLAPEGKDERNGQAEDDEPKGGGTGEGIELGSMHSVEAGPLHPTPWFHETKVPMYHGYVKTADLSLWDRNDRLDIHIRQFQQEYGRDPDRDELVQIMTSKMGLLGAEEDEFKIGKLANSIAVNGVRKPPVLDVDGTPLDGNRRIAACLLILNSDDYDAEQKKRVENLYVWKLTEFATADDRRAVVVSLNFEDDCKEQWRAYIKARKVYEDWQAMTLREPGAGTERMTRTTVTSCPACQGWGGKLTAAGKVLAEFLG